ncbi:MAG: L-2-amino-thiazoline-4-carboxylic acid hydrolase [Spirochaetales bacterium]|nr:L-2-amino-thiazoline-4-carboxylic acid hydrolase [Spirochaetales bacterium]
MSSIKNEAKINWGILNSIRGQLEQRAIWLALLNQEAEKKGLNPAEFGQDSIFQCGTMQGKSLSGGSSSFKTLKKNLFSLGARLVFEMKIKEATDDKLSIDFHYCPLVKGWQKMGLSDEKIAQLCDTAMCGDRGIATQFGGKLNLEKVIAKGDDICQIRFVKE